MLISCPTRCYYRNGYHLANGYGMSEIGITSVELGRTPKLRNRNAIGKSGRVYLTIPASHNGEGKVNVLLQGSYVEREAVTDEEAPIPTGAEVVVVGVSGQTTLVVKRK